MSISNSHGRYSTSPLVASEMTSFTADCSSHFPCVEPRFLPLCLVGSSELGIPGSVVLSESLPSPFFWHFLPSSLFWNLGFSVLCYMYPFVCLTNMLWSHSVPRMFSALGHSTEGGRAFQKRWPRRGLCWLCLTLWYVIPPPPRRGELLGASDHVFQGYSFAISAHGFWEAFQVTAGGVWR